MDKFPEAFARFEKSNIDISNVRDSNDLIRKFRYWINRTTTIKQDEALRIEARRLGIKITPQRRLFEYHYKPYVEEKPKVKPHYTFHKVKGKRRMVKRIRGKFA